MPYKNTILVITTVSYTSLYAFLIFDISQPLIVKILSIRTLVRNITSEYQFIEIGQVCFTKQIDFRKRMLIKSKKILSCIKRGIFEEFELFFLLCNFRR